MGRLPRAAQVGDRRREELRRPGRGHDHGRVVPAGVRGRLSLGALGHRGHGVHRQRRPPPGEGPDRGRRPALHRIHPQARGGVIRGLLGAAALLAVAAGAAAQVDTTARHDTTTRDSTARRDTTGRDSTPAYLAVFPEPIPAGPEPRGMRYSFTVDSFVLSNVQTLSDLLAHIPGVYVARGGIYGAAEPVLYGGRGAAGLELYWDGVPYLPLGRDSLRIYLVTARQRSTATASQVGIATGEVRTANYRGTYLRRWRSGLGLSLAADYNNNDGIAASSSAPFNSTDLWLKAEYVPSPHFGASYQLLSSSWHR